MSKDEEIAQLKETIAAERERADNAEARYASLHTMEADALREQLAAAVEALEFIAETELTGKESRRHADAAIAKIQK